MPASNSFWSVRIFLLFIYFSSCVQGYCPSPCYIMSTSCCPAFQELAKHIIPLSVALRVSDLEISGAMTFRPFVYCEFYDGWFRTASNWGLAVVLLDQQMNQKCSATPLNKNLSLSNFWYCPGIYLEAPRKTAKNLRIGLLWVDDPYSLKIQLP